MEERLIVQAVVGYMYKVQKNVLDVSKFRKEFAAIRHGYYFDFFNLIGKPVDVIVTYDAGKISEEKKVQEEDITFVALVKSGPSLKNFYSRCLKEYGHFTDPDLSNNDFERAALFELSLRMHSNNKRLSRKRVIFEKVINGLPLSESDKEVLHNGRRFINNIKRSRKQRGSWNEDLRRFNDAFSLMVSKKLTII